MLEKYFFHKLKVVIAEIFVNHRECIIQKFQATFKKENIQSIASLSYWPPILISMQFWPTTERRKVSIRFHFFHSSRIQKEFLVSKFLASYVGSESCAQLQGCQIFLGPSIPNW
jgi:hypothetical protein